MKKLNLLLLMSLMIFLFSCDDDDPPADDDDTTEENCESGSFVLQVDGVDWPYDSISVALQKGSISTGSKGFGIRAMRFSGEEIQIGYTKLNDGTDDCISEFVYLENYLESDCIETSFVTFCEGISGTIVETSIWTNDSEGSGSGTLTNCNEENSTISGSFNLKAYQGFGTDERSLVGSFENLCFTVY